MISLFAVAVAGTAGVISPVAVSFEETLNGCIEYRSWSDLSALSENALIAVGVT